MRISAALLSLLVWSTLPTTAPLVASPVFVRSTEPVNDYPVGQPIPTAANAPTGKEFGEVCRRWQERMYIENYRKAHPKDSEGLEFAKRAGTYFWSRDAAARKDANALAYALRRRGNDDPLFAMLAAVMLDDATQKEQLLRQSIAGFSKMYYPHYLSFMAAANLAMTLAQRKAPQDQIAAIDDIAITELRNTLTDGSFHNDEMLAFRWRLQSPSMSSLFQRQHAKLAELFQHAAALPEWLRELGQGIAWRVAAWEARTDGWADKVTDAGWEGWYRNLVQAREHFTKAWQLNSADPAAAAEMIEVAMGDGSNKAEMRQWFDRSVAAQMDYYDAYRALIWALRPRWHGSHAEMLQFGDECLATQRFDTCVPNYYFKVVSDIASEEKDPKALYERPEINHNLRAALEGYFARPDMPLLATFGHTMVAILDYRKGDLASARAHMVAISWVANDGVGRGLAEDIPAMMAAIAAR